jgi:hypothetical protein
VRGSNNGCIHDANASTLTYAVRVEYQAGEDTGTVKRRKVDEMLEWKWDEDAIEASDRLKPSVRLDMAHEAELVSHRTYAVKIRNAARLLE